MGPRFVRRTKFTDGTIAETNRLQSLPSHPVARRDRDKRDYLLPCFEIFETVFLLSDDHDKRCCPNQSCLIAN